MNAEFRMKNAEWFKKIIESSWWWLIPAFFFIPVNVEALTISPLRHTVVIDPGQSQTVSLTITNDGNKTITLVPEIDAFQLDPQIGTAVFGARDEAVSWVEPAERQLTVRSGATRETVFQINVPKEAEPGSHYLALFANQAPAAGTIGVGARVGALLFLHVAGEVREELTREDFFSTRAWYAKPPLTLSLWLRNNGTIHVVPVGEVLLQKGGQVIDRQSLNTGERKILPGARWEESYQFEKLAWRDVGRIEAVASLQYGLTRQPIVDRVAFWYLPAGLLVTIAVGLILVFVGWLIVKKKKGRSLYQVVE